MLGTTSISFLFIACLSLFVFLCSRQDKAQGTRKYSHMVINALADKLPELIGGSADLTGSNNTDFK